MLIPARPGPARHVSIPFFSFLAKVLFFSHEKEALSGADKAYAYISYPFHHFVFFSMSVQARSCQAIDQTNENSKNHIHSRSARAYI